MNKRIIKYNRLQKETVVVIIVITIIGVGMWKITEQMMVNCKWSSEEGKIFFSSDACLHELISIRVTFHNQILIASVSININPL